MEDQTGAKTISGMEESKDNSQERATSVKHPSNTITPNLLKTRVNDSQQPNTQQSNLPLGGDSRELRNVIQV